jgi:hypothetical protein
MLEEINGIDKRLCRMVIPTGEPSAVGYKSSDTDVSVDRRCSTKIARALNEMAMVVGGHKFSVGRI